MSQTINYPFTDGDNYTYDTDKIEVVDGGAQLKPINNPGQSFSQPFTSDTGFTYDNTVTEFSGGKLQQVDQAPTSSTCWATYTTDLNLTYGGGTLTGTAVGGASISGNRLDLAHNDIRYVNYDADLNADSQQVGCVRFKLTPNYSGSPSANNVFFVINKQSGSLWNLIQIWHKTDGNVALSLYNNVGAAIAEVVQGVWSPTASVTYEIEFNWDFTTGATRLFIDGTQFGATVTNTGTRSDEIDLLRIGGGYAGSNVSNFYVEDLLVFSAVQHTSNYTPGYTLAEFRYVEDLVVLPSFSYSDVGSLQSYSTFTTTQTGLVRFNINGQYWTGSAWAGSDDSYAQMNAPTDINAAIVNLLGADTTSLKLRTVSQNATQQDVDLLTIGYIGQIYPTDNPTIEPNTTFNAENFISFATAFCDLDNNIAFTRKTDDVEYYWTGTVWAESSGYSQSNTTVEMNNSGAFTGGATTVVVYLHSNDGSTTPGICDITIIYDVFVPPDELPSTCEVNGYILDGNNQVLTSGTVRAVPVIEGFITDKNWLVNLTPIEASLDSTGRFELELIRSAEYRNAIKYNFIITPTSDVIKPIRYYNVTVPDSASAEFNDMVTTT